MKINQGQVSESSPPYNEIYDAYEAFFLRLFEQRRVFHSSGDNGGYVPMPDTEARLTNFVRSGSSEICLFVGPIGVGKSSVLRQLYATSWSGTPNSETVFIDLNRKKATLEKLLSSELLTTLNSEQQKLLINSNVQSYVASVIESHIAGESGMNAETEELFEFFWDNNKDLLMPVSTFKPTSKEDKEIVLRMVQMDKREAFLFVCLKYYALTRKLKSLVIVIDNCDQKDALLIEAFVDTLCHLDNCFENIEGPYDFIPRLTCILSCRPATRWMLLEGKRKNALGSHGVKVVSMDQPCSLAALIKNRIAGSPPELLQNQVRVSSRNGIVWEFARHQRFLEKLTESIESAHHGAIILALCNWNVADALVALTEILSNRFFTDMDKIIGDITTEDGQPEHGFTKLTILRALAYGNPVTEPLYPIKKTRVPNLISGTKSTFPKTFIKPRLLQLILLNSEKGNGHSKLQTIITFAKDYFAKSESDTKAIIDEFYEEGLVETNRGIIPSMDDANSCHLSATARANLLWSELYETDFLLGIFRDDLHLSAKHTFGKIPTFQLGLAQRCYEIVALGRDCVEGELQELRQIASRADIEEFMSIFGNSLISEKLLGGIGVSLYTFYSKYMRGDYVVEIDDEFRKISDLITAGKKCLQKGQIEL